MNIDYTEEIQRAYHQSDLTIQETQINLKISCYILTT